MLQTALETVTGQNRTVGTICFVNFVCTLGLYGFHAVNKIVFPCTRNACEYSRYCVGKYGCCRHVRLTGGVRS